MHLKEGFFWTRSKTKTDVYGKNAGWSEPLIMSDTNKTTLFPFNLVQEEAATKRQLLSFFLNLLLLLLSIL